MLDKIVNGEIINQGATLVNMVINDKVESGDYKGTVETVYDCLTKYSEAVTSVAEVCTEQSSQYDKMIEQLDHKQEQLAEINKNQGLNISLILNLKSTDKEKAELELNKAYLLATNFMGHFTSYLCKDVEALIKTHSSPQIGFLPKTCKYQNLFQDIQETVKAEWNEFRKDEAAYLNKRMASA